MSRHPPGALAKVAWRLRFLHDPAAFAVRQPFFSERPSFPLRELLLDEARSLSLRDRLDYVDPRTPTPAIGDYLLRRRRRLGSEGAYFDLGARRIYYDHGADAGGDRERRLEGVMLALREAYVEPVEFFDGPVTIRRGDTVLDVGGNVGTSALLFSELTGPGGRVYSFEPVFADALRLTVIANDADNVVVEPVAVADREGAAVFSVTALGIDSRMRGPRFAGGTGRAVSVTTLDAFLARAAPARVDFVKMDIEGAEGLALRGAQTLIERFRPRWSIASYHTDPEGEPQHPKLVRWLRARGYRVREKGVRHIYAW